MVRHGETEYNLEHRIQGQGDSPLTDRGIRQAEAVAAHLSGRHFAAVYSSDLGRARQTAEIIAAPHSLPVHTTPLLREAHFGTIQGLTHGEIEERFPADEHEWRRDPTNLRPPGAETYSQIVARCREFITQAANACEDGARLLVVGHGGSLRGLVLAALGLPMPVFRMLHFSNASLSILNIDTTSSIRLLNDTCHLVLAEVTDVDADSTT